MTSTALAAVDTAPPVILVGVSGSLRSEPYNHKLLRAAVQVAPPAAEPELRDGPEALPSFHQGDEEAPGELLANPHPAAFE
jgi:NAD(P)H-dependent FMN reductase